MGLEAYQLIKQLGVGRDGSAYQARHRATERLYEIRTISSGSASEKVRLLERRCMQLALLHHPSALKLEELDASGEVPFLALEWFERGSLASSWEQRLPVPPGEVLPVLEAIAHTLVEAHRIGVIHGQLHPSEIFKSPSDLRIDFTGIDVSSLISTNKRSFSQVHFAPPAVMRRAPDPAADVYALGHLMYWAMFGSIIQHATLPADFEGRLSALAGRALPAAELSALLRGALAAEASERPSAREVLRRLTLLREAGAKVVARPQSAPSREQTPTAQPSKRAYPVTTQPISRNLTALSPPTRPISRPQSQPLPTMPVSANRLQAQHPARHHAADDILQTTPSEPAIERFVGRYQLLSLLGEGGVGAVYRAKDESDGAIVAIKTIQAQWLSEPEAVARFLKEARILAEIQSPYVIKLFEVNEDDSKHFIVMEYIAGGNLRGFLHQQRKIQEPLAISLIADIARALIEVHAHGVVHRDIKPENILLVSSVPQSISDGPRAKLADFGVARTTIQTHSMALTQPGGYLGTPLYMSPEQCLEKKDLDARADIYSLGATLFHIATGQPPFSSDTTSGLIAMHCNEPPPNPQALNPALSDALCEVILKCLAKTPQSRYQDARALLQDLERVQRGEPTSLLQHPKTPEHDPKEAIDIDVSLDFPMPPQEVWPHFCDTERFNRAMGYSAVDYSYYPDETYGTRRLGKMNVSGLTIQWEEYPYEWVAERRSSTIREYTKGPWKWHLFSFQLTPTANGGTNLSTRLRLVPLGVVGKIVARLEGRKLKQKMEELRKRVIQFASSDRHLPEADPYEPPHELPKNKQAEISAIEERLTAQGVQPNVARALCEMVAKAPPQLVARIRPIAAARKLNLPEDEVIEACLHASREGLLVLLWDLLCPVCRVPSQIQETLQALKSHGRCQACQLDFELDFSNSVEMIFQAHPSLRDTKLGTYCIGTPFAAPHVNAQVRVHPKERIEIELSLPQGDYKVRGLSPLAFSVPLRVEEGVATDRIEFTLEKVPAADPVRLARPGAQLWVIENKLEVPLVLRVERAIPRDDVITAAKASSMGLFRELFPREVLSAGQLISVAKVCFLFVEVLRAQELYQQLGEQTAFAQLLSFLREVEQRLKRAAGALVKTTSEGALLVFEDTTAALRFALSLRECLQESSRPLKLRAAVHHGAAMVTTLNEHLDYFGTSVNFANRILQLANQDELVISETVAMLPSVVALLREKTAETFQSDVLHQKGAVLHRYKLE